MRRPRNGAGFSASVQSFGDACRAAGLRITTGQLVDLCQAGSIVNIFDVDEFYAAARCLLLTRHRDEPVFLDTFQRFWLGSVPRQMQPENWQIDRLRPSEVADDPVEALAENVQIVHLLNDGDDLGNDDVEGGADQDQHRAATYSASEVLRRKDFSQLDERDIAEVKRLISELRWHTAQRKLRRSKRAAKGPRIDPRRALRENLTKGGELIVLPRRRPRRKARPLVLICDISGSMERYTSLLLRFLHAVRQGRSSVETFVFGTRLTRITRQLRVRDTDAALADVAADVLDWGGGTRIGDCLATFNRLWARRVLGHGATVIVISDGWDRGDPSLLASEMAHLQRLSHRLIWLNPLLGLAGYEPLTRGMQAALPYIDDFLASHNLDSLEQLANFLQDLDEHRPERSTRRHSA